MVVSNFTLSNKICVVTGGGSGIGLSFVKLALKSNARVLIADLKQSDEASEVVKSSNGNAAFTTCDVSKWPQLEALPSEVEKAFGKGEVADVWVPAAGVFEPKWSSFVYDEEKEFYMALRINTEHPIKLTRIAMRSLLSANKPGVIMLISSGAGISGTYPAALYCATKHAVVGFTKSMAQADIDENIKVVCILPGMVSTPLWTGQDAKHVNEQFSFTEDVCISPDDVAEAMKDMIEKSEYEGGSLMECKKGDLRGRLESQQSLTAEALGGPEAAEKFFGRLYKPLREVFGKERGSKRNGV